MTTYKELQEQITELKRQAETLLKVERDQAIANIVEQMGLFGISAQELTAKPQNKSRGTSAVPKFQDPDSGKTWSGRGRQPSWIKGPREKYLIK